MRHFLFTLITLLATLTASGAIPARVKAAADKVNSAPALQVTFKANGHPATMLLGDGGKFSLIMGDIKVYYDGKTQWAYSAADKEVTILNPTADELASGNPAAILSTLSSAFKGEKIKGETYRLTPLSPNAEIAEVTIAFPAAGPWPQSMSIIGPSGSMSVSDLKFTSLKTKKPLQAFQFKAPKGTTITDLR